MSASRREIRRLLGIPEGYAPPVYTRAELQEQLIELEAILVDETADPGARRAAKKVLDAVQHEILQLDHPEFFGEVDAEDFYAPSLEAKDEC